MRDGWVTTSLSEVVEHSIGGVWGGESGTDEVEVTVVRSTEFTKRGFLNFETGVPRSIKSSQLKSRELKPGDILLEKSGGGPDQPVGRVVFVTEAIPEKFVCSNFVQLVRPNLEQIEPLLLFHIMWQWHAINRTLEFQAQTTGIRNLRTPDYLEQEISLPPLPEQKRIVDLISSVDSYIEALQQQLESAKKSRNAVLHELLTAGGDDWVEHKLIDMFEIYQPQTIAKSLMSDDGEFIVFGANGPIGRYHEFNHDEPEVVVTCRGATCGTVNMTLPKTWITGNAMVVSPKTSEVSKEFLYWALVAGVDIQSVISGSAQPQITREGLASVKIKIPPLSIQKEIVDLISGFELNISNSEETLNNAKSLRSGLLSDLLSGEHEIPASYDKVIGAA
jgi:restriction endonuclease S subunit